MSTQMSIRIDEELKQEFTETLNGMGLNVSTVVTMLAKQVVAKKVLPFEVKYNESKEAHDAKIKDAAIELGLIPDDRPTFENGQKAVEYLESL
jgi:DNA-damage-inducible protein J